MGISLVSKSIISVTDEANRCYDILCGKQKNLGVEIMNQRRDILPDVNDPPFEDKHQAFWVAAVIGHIQRDGDRYSPSDKAGKMTQLIRRSEWDSPDKEDLRVALTYLVKIKYGVGDDDDEVLQVVTELAECGIRHILDQYKDKGKYDFFEEINHLKKSS